MSWWQLCHHWQHWGCHSDSLWYSLWWQIFHCDNLFPCCVKIASWFSSVHLRYAFIWSSVGHVTLVAITGTTGRVSNLFKSNHCNSFEDQVPADFICGYLIFKWVAVICLHYRYQDRNKLQWWLQGWHILILGQIYQDICRLYLLTIS